MRRRTNLSQNPTTRPARGAAPDITGTITQIHRDANQTESLGASQIWSGNSLAGRSCRRWRGLVTGSWRGAGQALCMPLRERLEVRTTVAVSTMHIVHESRAYERARCGGIPQHKGGLKARPPKCEERGVSDTVCSGVECDWN